MGALTTNFLSSFSSPTVHLWAPWVRISLRFMLLRYVISITLTAYLPQLQNFTTSLAAGPSSLDIKNKSTNLLFKMTKASMESLTVENVNMSPVWAEGTGAQNFRNKLFISGKDLNPEIWSAWIIDNTNTDIKVDGIAYIGRWNSFYHRIFTHKLFTGWTSIF